MDNFFHLATFISGYGCYDRHNSVRLVICFDSAINQIAKIGLSSLQVIYYFEILFRGITYAIDLFNIIFKVILFLTSKCTHSKLMSNRYKTLCSNLMLDFFLT
ncbi:hypothetical protein XBFFL1_300009 [Xenorhabdus bovienii str. feltiae Florida]|uniref:Uncharacterized protein n=1 Tax=Xenorhabdus bovienii str. oregonense TaxID=1398202 RepID=A0A077NS29_XENBV|nr:hypothetical protein XBFFR1_1730009 [Xenorhabdus bovienii str. feltiae France]CDG94014.1 hypothetical protein XBFFL1_300009 [Xenorhabdus bovienii str. feltiae Florida]CDH04882.1 hypothetical protein XBO1_1510011 [Xenorhabdus bovienii str. oregonense]